MYGWECDNCTKCFNSQGAVEQHMNALGHWANYCNECQRSFDNANNLRMVLTHSLQSTIGTCRILGDSS